MKNKYFIISIHIFGWLAFFSPPIMILAFTNNGLPLPELTKDSPLFIIFSLHFGLVAFFYSNCYWLLPSFYDRNKKWIYFLIVFSIIALYFYLNAKLQPLNAPSMNPRGMFVPPGMPDGFKMNNFEEMKNRMEDAGKFGKFLSLFFFLFIWVVSSMLYLLTKYQKTKELNKELELENKSTELSYLKAQIHPHFLFNSLNSIYSLAISKSEYTADAVVKLSDIMRYVIVDADKTLVPLVKEIEYIYNFIDLQKLRTNDKVMIDYTAEGDFTINQIAPLLLIGFVENAFKFGISHHEASPVTVSISINNDLLKMRVTNNIYRNVENEGTNTGLKNIKRRLELQYHDKYQLKTETDYNKYSVTLELKLS